MTKDNEGWERICCAIVYAAAEKYRGPRMGLAALARADALLWYYGRAVDKLEGDDGD